MSDIEKKRVAMLAVSGLLLGATVFGWARYIDSTSASRDAGPPVSQAALKNAALPQAAAPSAGQTPDSVAIAGMIPASQPVAVGVIARRSAGRANPMAALDYGSAFTPGQYRRYQQDQGPAALDVPLPPPPDPAAGNAGETRGYMPAPRPLPPLKEAIHLVGVMDGKAIFTVPSDVAAEHGVTPSFTLGEGQKYAGITVQEIKTRSVTVSDGKSICTKELSTLN